MQLKKQKWHSVAVPIALISFLIGGQTVYAQERGSGFSSPTDRRIESSLETPDDIAEKESRWMKKKLKLRKEQLQRVKAINAVYAFKRKDYEKAMDPANSGNKQKIIEKLDMLDKEKDDELRKVFTEKQYATYLKKKPELIEKIRSKANDKKHLPPRSGNGGF